jgi:hypothetical protein
MAPHPPNPLSNSASLRGLRGEGEREKIIPPLHAALQSNAKLERGLGGEARIANDFLNNLSVLPLCFGGKIGGNPIHRWSGSAFGLWR